MNCKKFLTFFLSAGLVLSMLTGCAPANTPTNVTSEPAQSNGEQQTQGTSQEGTTTASPSPTQRLDEATLFTDRDKSGDYDENAAVKIALSDSGSSCADSGAVIDGSIITIQKEGVYVLSGSLSNGQIIVEVDSKDKVQLVLNNADISNQSSAAIYVKQADKVFVTLAEGTENRLTTKGSFTPDGDTNVDGVIFSKDDLTINGGGKLAIQSQQGHGIVSKDDLVVTGGTMTVSSAGHALSGKDSVRICGGVFDLTAGKDGIHSDNADDETKGYGYISGGVFTMDCDGDGVSASSLLQITGGRFDLTTAEGSANVTHTQQDFMRGGNKGQFGQQAPSTTAAETQTTPTEVESVSCKGFKATTLLLDGGTMTLDTADDAFHANDTLEVTDGTFTVSTGDDGFHADNVLTITGGTIDILTCYEGLEGASITVSGGDTSIVASDDGINAAGGRDGSGSQGFGGMNDPFASDNSSLVISGGTLTIDAQGDGLDSNGSLVINGGTIFVYGPTNSGNGALDHNGGAEINGGTLIAVSNSTMEELIEDGTQASFAQSLTESVSGTLTLSNGGKPLLTCDPSKNYSFVFISSPDLTENGSYTLTTGSLTTNVTMNGLHTNNASVSGGFGGHGGMGGGMKGENGQKPDRSQFGDGQFQKPDRGQMPTDGQAPTNGQPPQLPESSDPPQQPQTNA